MAGRGPAPKDPARRVRRNADLIPGRVIRLAPADVSRDLPDDILSDGEVWHPATRRWWRRWVDSPLAADLPEVDWSELEATAVLHHQFMQKRTFTLAGELRQRMQKFGATPEDRARLRIQVADADEKDEKRSRPGSSSRARRGPLTDAG